MLNGLGIDWSCDKLQTKLNRRQVADERLNTRRKRHRTLNEKKHVIGAIKHDDVEQMLNVHVHIYVNFFLSFTQPRL